MFGREEQGYNSSPYNRNQSGYGYGYSNYQQPRGGLFGRNNMQGSSYGAGMFGSNSGYESRGVLGGLFGRRNAYAGYGTRRGILGGVGQGIAAIGSLVGGAQALAQHRREVRIEQGKKPYEELPLEMWLYLNGSYTVIPIKLSLYYLSDSQSGEQSKDCDTRYTVRVGRLKKVPTGFSLKELREDTEDGVACCVNFIIEPAANGKLRAAVIEDAASKDDWVRLQAISEVLCDYSVVLNELLASDGIRNEPIEHARLMSTIQAAVCERLGFQACASVDCKASFRGTELSWCATDVLLRRSDGQHISVRVDLLHYYFGSEDSNTESEVPDVYYGYSAGGIDIFDSQQRLEGSGEFTGWEGSDDFLQELAKGVAPVKQSPLQSNGAAINIPVVSQLVSGYRNKHRISGRKERAAKSQAEEAGTDTVFRNLLWYDLKSKPGKVMVKALPFCLLPTYDSRNGITDKDIKPVSVGYSFMPAEKEYLCCDEDLELYFEEIQQGVSIPINFSIVQTNSGYTLKRKNVCGMTDDWDRLQYITRTVKHAACQLYEDFDWWFDSCTDEDASRFESAVLAAALRLAGFSYATPITVAGDWSVVDVSLVRPKTSKTLLPKRFKEVTASLHQRCTTFDAFLGGVGKSILNVAREDSVMVRVDIQPEEPTYSYAEKPILDATGAPIVTTTRAGWAPFTGWKNDLDYYMDRKGGVRHSSSASTSKKQSEFKAAVSQSKASVPKAQEVPEDTSPTAIQEDSSCESSNELNKLDL